MFTNYKKIYPPEKIRGFEVVRDEFRKNKDVKIKLPQRATKFSAGYDFYSPVSVVISPHESVLIWTDVKAYMLPDEVLLLDVRSSVGIKKGLMLSNTVGVIDSDYYNNDNNDGNIGISLRNMTDTFVEIEAGERIAQGIFVHYLVADEDVTILDERNGGIGSSNEVKK